VKNERVFEGNWLIADLDPHFQEEVMELAEGETMEVSVPTFHESKGIMTGYEQSMFFTKHGDKVMVEREPIVWWTI
jgi:hypothetical protein